MTEGRVNGRWWLRGVVPGDVSCLWLCLIFVEKWRMSKRPVQKQLVHVLMLSLEIMLMGGGFALLYQWQQGPIPSDASKDNDVGPPSLPASYANKIFRRLGSPMVGPGQAVEKPRRTQRMDDTFAPHFGGTE